uniref:Uncharacterized protein n=1 Tax=Trichobilharzia regenti TaxID=157069 RepID=A0AA85KFJ5_TRIRE|nr:unnamed protein product [Trichobilharzia regenti]
MGIISDLHQPDGTSSDSQMLPSTSVNPDSKLSPPYLNTSGVIPSGPAALPSFRLVTALVTSVRDGGPVFISHSGRCWMLGRLSVAVGKLNCSS